MRRFILLCLLLGLVLPGIPHSIAQDSESLAPYLYYFSEAERGIVIERADGSERHFIETDTFIDYRDYQTEYDAEDTGITANNIKWSPSGKWVSFQLEWFHSVYGRTHPIQPITMNIETGERLTILDEYDSAEMVWSPVDDYLLIRARDYKPDFNSIENGDTVLYSDVIMLVDASKNNIISSIEFNREYLAPKNLAVFYSSLNWTQDGEHAVVEVRSRSDDTAATFYMFDKTGQMYIRTFSEVLGLSPVTSEDILYMTTQGIIHENIITGDMLANSFIDIPEANYPVYWNHNGRSALLGTEWLVDFGPRELLNSNTDRVKTLDPVVPLKTFAYYRWGGNLEMWSPEGNYGLLLSDEAVYLLEVSTGNLQQLDFNLDSDSRSDSGLFYWDWVSDTEVVFSNPISGDYDTPSRPAEFVRYNILTDSYESLAGNLPLEYPGCISYKFNMVGDNITYVKSGPVIHDIQDNETQLYRPNSRNYFSDWGGETVPDPSNGWLLVYENSFVAGGCGEATGARYVSVMNLDGAIHRELPDVFRGFEIKWLPETVDPSSLPQIEPETQPVKVLTGDEWARILDWHPTDNKIMVISLNYWFYDQGSIHVWDIDTETREVILEDVRIVQRWHWKFRDGEYKVSMINPALNYGPISFDNDTYSISQPDGSYFPIVTSLESGEQIAELQVGEYFFITNGEFSPDGRYFAGGSDVHGDVAFIWDTQTWQVVATLPHPSPAITFSPDSTQIAVAAAWDIEIWNLADLLHAPPD